MYFPTSEITGIPRRRFYAAPPDYDQITDSWEYEDGGKDFNEVASNAPRRWEYEFDLLSNNNSDPASVAIFDNFYAAARKVNPFYFTDKYGDTHFPVFIEEYSRTHERHLPRVQTVKFKLVGYNTGIVSVDPTPTVSLASADLVSGNIVITGTVSEAADLYLQLNGEFYSMINDNGGFTFSVPLALMNPGVNTFTVIAVNSMGGFDVSNTVTYATDVANPVVSITSPTPGQIVSGTITITATAYDDVEVDRVEFFYFDGVGFAPISQDPSDPYTAVLNTELLPNGPLIIEAIAFDTSGKLSPTANVTATIYNGIIPAYTITNETELRALDCNAYTLDQIADLFATLVGDLTEGAPIPAYTITNGSTLRVLNANSYTSDNLADLLATIISDLGSGDSISGYTVTNDFTLRTLNADSYTPDNLADLIATLIRDLGGVAAPDLTPTITTMSLPDGTEGDVYNQTISVTGGDAPITFSKPSGTLPTGTALNSSTGAITGTLTTPGSYTFTIRATDNDGDYDEQTYTVEIDAAVSYDADAAAAFTATGLSDTAKKNAVNQLFVSLKGAGLFTKIHCLYLPVFGSAAMNKWNWKNPVDSDAAKRLTFSGGWDHSGGGATPNGVNAFADTHYVPGTHGVSDDSHLSYYSATDSPGGFDIAANGAGVPHAHQMAISFAGVGGDFLVDTYGSGGQRIMVPVTDSLGLFTDVRRSATDHEAYKGGVSIGTDTSTSAGSTLITHSYYLGARNYATTADAFSNHKCRLATIGLSLTDSEVAAFNTIVEDFLEAIDA